MLDGETMQQELEYEFEDEYEGLFEDEYESEDFMGDSLREAGRMTSMAGEGEYEDEDEGEAFFKKVKSLARRLKPVLQKVAPKAVQVVGSAIGGAGVGNTLSNIAKQLSRESEFEYESTFESEFEDEFEYESTFAGEFEEEFESATIAQPEALAEALAMMASQVQSEAEAEAYTGAFTARIIPVKSLAMQRIYPRLVRGTAALTQTLRKSPTTRPLVKTIPTIAARAGQKLARQAAQGKSITPTTAARVMAAETKKVLGNPMASAQTLLRSSKAARKVTQPQRSRL